MPAAENGDPFEFSDRPYRPALLRAWPGESVGEYLPARLKYGRVQEIPFSDGEWRTVTVLGQMRASGGGWRVLVQWFDGGSTHEDWLIYDPQRFREPPGE